ncbi:hypothetical protein CFP56_038575 [Quercus suber]|uniref:C2H2-type domain-containing protein n=1 Tax=Quercus suber TaxID=58331 RepID=A0AAW0LPD1_QUESU
MDAQARKKAVFRAKLNAKKKEKRIDSPLVRMKFRYNELEQPVCRVCDIVLKSESHWDAHPVSRKHHEVIFYYRHPVCRVCDIVLKSESHWDAHPVSRKHHEVIFYYRHFWKGNKYPACWGGTSTSEDIAGSKINQAKGALPEGFFDNKDADLCVLGIKPVKLDIKDEYKEFEKLIQEDLQEVDDRFEEEEIDAAETIEEAESVEQKTYWEKVEMLKKKKLELQVARPVKRRKASEGVAKESRHEESSSDDDSGENFAVDWRAQHL